MACEVRQQCRHRVQRQCGRRQRRRRSRRPSRPQPATPGALADARRVPAPRPSSRPPLRSTTVTSQPERIRMAPAKRPPREPPITIARGMSFPGHRGRDVRSDHAVFDPLGASSGAQVLIAPQAVYADGASGRVRGMTRILIHGATILTLDPRIGDLRGDILVEGARIVAVAPSISADDAELIPAKAHDCAAGLCRFPPPYLAVAVARRRDRLDACAIFRRNSWRHGPPLHSRRHVCR